METKGAFHGMDFETLQPDRPQQMGTDDLTGQAQGAAPKDRSCDPNASGHQVIAYGDVRARCLYCLKEKGPG